MKINNIMRPLLWKIRKNNSIKINKTNINRKLLKRKKNDSKRYKLKSNKLFKMKIKYHLHK